MDPSVLRAMEEASRTFVELDKAQLAASGVIAAVTGAEAGYVVGGAAAGLALAAAACMAGDDLDRIRRLPDAEGMPNEIILPEGHEIYYERFIRLAGARLTFVPDEAALDRAIGPETVGIFFEASMPEPIPRSSLVAIGRAAGIPVVADAAVARASGAQPPRHPGRGRRPGRFHRLKGRARTGGQRLRGRPRPILSAQSCCSTRTGTLRSS